MTLFSNLIQSAPEDANMQFKEGYIVLTKDLKKQRIDYQNVGIEIDDIDEEIRNLVR